MSTGEKYYFVTGGKGFLGSYIVKGLLALPNTAMVCIFDLSVTDSEARQSILTRKSTTSAKSSTTHTCSPTDIDPRNPRLSFIKGNITLPESLLPAMCEYPYDVVFHVAALVRSETLHPWDRNKFNFVNVKGTDITCQCARKAGISKFVYTSSISSVCPADVPMVFAKESDCPPPKTNICYYSRSKLAGELRVISHTGKPVNNRADSSNSWNSLLNMDLTSASGSPFHTVIIRPGVIFGPGELQFSKLISGKEYMRVSENPSSIAAHPDVSKETESPRAHLQRRSALSDFVYASNVSDAHLAAAERLFIDPRSVSGQQFFITNDNPLPWDTFFAGTTQYYEKAKNPSFDKAITFGTVPYWVFMAYIYFFLLVEFVFALVQKTFFSKPQMRPWFSARVSLGSSRYMVYSLTFSSAKARSLLCWKPVVTVEDGMRIFGSWIAAEEKKKTS